MENLIISIIVPIYNVENDVRKCIESIRNQTYPYLDIILVDDGSTDNSGLICDEYARKDSRIAVIHKENGGLVSARKAGAQAAKGSYVTNVDGDDWIEPDRIENCVNKGIPSGADMIFMIGWIKDYGDRQIPLETETVPGKYSIDEAYEMLSDTSCCFLRRIIPSMCNWLIKKELYKTTQLKVDNRVSMGEDQLFVWMCLLEANYIYAIEDLKYHYVQRSDSISRVASEKELEQLRILYSQIKNEFQQKQVEERMYIRLAFAVMRTIISMDYQCIAKLSRDCLYPFATVKKGSRVVVYGAGDTGVRMVQYLAACKDYELTAWVDKYEHNKCECGYQSQEIERLLEDDYDYITIAIVNYTVSQKVKKDLIDMGIQLEKIVVMDPNVISIESVETCLSIGL